MPPIVLPLHGVSRLDWIIGTSAMEVPVNPTVAPMSVALPSE